MRRAFTLVELGVTIFVIAVIGATVLTGLSHYRQALQRNVMQGTIDMSLSLAKQEAMTQRCNVDVLFFDNGITVQTDDEILKELKLPKPYTVSSLRLGYNAAGNPRFAGTLYLYRQGKTAAKMTSAVGNGLITWTKQ